MLDLSKKKQVDSLIMNKIGSVKKSNFFFFVLFLDSSFKKIFIFLSLLFTSQVSFAAFSAQEFQSYVDSLIPGSRLGMSVRSVKTGNVFLNIRGDEFFTPASTLKTLTTATALHLLPLNYEPQTTLHLEGSIKENIFSGRLRFYGEGDPNISGRFYTDAFYMMNQMVDSLKTLGIDTIRGSLFTDTSYFSGPRRPEHWKSNYYDAWYGAEVVPLGFNDNCTLIRIKPGANVNDTAIISLLPDVGFVTIKNELITTDNRARRWRYSIDKEKPVITISGTIGIKVDSSDIVLPVRNPSAYFLRAFETALKDAGITYIEDYKVHPGIEIKKYRFSAAPLLSMLDEINQRSQNLHAEMLFRNVGKIVAGEGSVEGGKKAETIFLNQIGISPSYFKVFDGCGLSPLNKVKPSVITEMLSYMARSPRSYFYIESFASPGVGTASKRMNSLAMPQQTRLKTGFISEAHALVGYIFTMTGDTLSVSAYLNDTGKNPDSKAKDVLDTLWSRLVEKSNDHYPSLMLAKKLWLQGLSVKGLENRLDYFSKALLNTPYLLGPMGESYIDSIDSKPLIYLDSVDCVTYIEHVLALATASHEDSVFSQLQRIRYFDGKIGYLYRKHYFVEDFLGENVFASVRIMEGDTTIIRELPKKDFFASKKIKYQLDNPKTEIHYLPYTKSISFAKKVWEGESAIWGVAFVGTSPKIDATHTGFLILENGKKPVLRHASQLKKKVVNQNFDEYLKSRKGKLPGVVFFNFLEL